MKTYLKVFIVAVLVSITGCSALASKINPVVAGYCSKSIADRSLAREILAAEIAPNRIEVICAADK